VFSPGALQLAIDADISVVLCVGESLAEREAGHTLQVVTRQLQAVAAVVPAAHWASRIVIAYEPVWAIGTGKVASAEQAQEAHAAIRAWLADKVSAEAAAGTRIVYGGSVNVSRCYSLSPCMQGRPRGRSTSSGQQPRRACVQASLLARAGRAATMAWEGG